MVRPLFYRTDSHRSGLEDVKRRHGTNGKSEVTERGLRSAAVASPFFTLLQFSHVLYSLYISHRVLYNSGVWRDWSRPFWRLREDGIKWKTCKSDQPLRLSFHFWYYFIRIPFEYSRALKCCEIQLRFSQWINLLSCSIWLNMQFVNFIFLNLKTCLIMTICAKNYQAHRIMLSHPLRVRSK